MEGHPLRLLETFCRRWRPGRERPQGLQTTVKTHRAYTGADSVVTCWVRDEVGSRDLSGETLAVPVYAYGHPCELLTLDAAQAMEGEASIPGKVEFTVTQPAINRYFPTGLYRFAILAGDEVVYGGLLEVV